MDLADLEAFLRSRLAAPLPGAGAQRRFAPRPARRGWEPDQVPDHARRASALILIYPGASGPLVPLTVRRDDLPHHPGQVSLPGGGVDPGESAEDAALREAREELGIATAGLRLVGGLSPLWVIVSNFVVRPFVALADERPPFHPAPHEVAALVEVPLDELRDPARLKWTRVLRDGVRVACPYFDVAGQKVWGATAMMLGEFACLFDEGFRPPEPP